MSFLNTYLSQNAQNSFNPRQISTPNANVFFFNTLLILKYSSTLLPTANRKPLDKIFWNLLVAN